MGAIWFNPEILVDSLAETIGYKAGLALSFENICEHLEDTGLVEVLRKSEIQMVRLRTEDYEDLFYELLHKVGYTEERYYGDPLGIELFHKYKNTNKKDQYLGVLEIFSKMLPMLSMQALKNKNRQLDPSSFLTSCATKYGKIGLTIAMEHLSYINKGINLSPVSKSRYTEWVNIEELDNLFKKTNGKPMHGEYIDQRYIDYLSNNHEKIKNMHWRKFEELTAEYYYKKGFNVELGPGGNDDGVDVRVWKDSQEKEFDAPHFIIQCKREKDKVDKVTVKGLYADIKHEKANYGLIVTSSELSPGAKKTVISRGYPIKEINNIKLKTWLKQLRTPGSGIVRI